ncbi:MAG: TnpV protein [Acutalibacteraceae bacterium]|nr:TnpV protein [Acutalibacteraceae bacterium]
MNITYSRQGDYNLPNITVPEQVEAPTGIYAQLRLEYLKEHRKGLYTNLLTSFKMTEHLTEVDKRANEMQARLVDELAKKEGVTEELKVKDMMTWVGKMNNIRDRVREIVLAEVIYA